MKIITNDSLPRRLRKKFIPPAWPAPAALRLLSCLLAGALALRGAPDAPAAPPPAAAPADAAPPAAAVAEAHPWKFVAGLSTKVTYDDNVFIRSADARDDIYAQIAPTLAIGRGNFREELSVFASIPHFLIRPDEEELPWKNFSYASYTPEVVLFSEYSDENTVNHDVRLAGRKETELSTVQGHFRFKNEASPNIDVGRRIDRSTFTADGDAAYEFTGKVTAGAGFAAKHNAYAGGHDSSDGQIAGHVDYQIAPKTALGVRLVGGYLDVASGSNQTYEQALLQVNYMPGGKISFIGQMGAELRQYDDIADRTHFVFNASTRYEAGSGTLLILSVNRQTTASAEYAGENIVESTYEARLRQRLLERLYLSVAGGYVNNRYENNQPTASVVARRDDYHYYRGSLACDVTRHGTVELFYEHRENDSSFASFSFNGDLCGAAAVFLF